MMLRTGLRIDEKEMFDGFIEKGASAIVGVNDDEGQVEQEMIVFGRQFFFEAVQDVDAKQGDIIFGDVVRVGIFDLGQEFGLARHGITPFVNVVPPLGNEKLHARVQPMVAGDVVKSAQPFDVVSARRVVRAGWAPSTPVQPVVVGIIIAEGELKVNDSEQPIDIIGTERIAHGYQ
jgi:hypothetical protein